MSALKYVSHEGKFYFPMSDVQWGVWESKKEHLYLAMKAAGASKVGQYFNFAANPMRSMQIEAPTLEIVDRIARLLASELGGAVRE